MTSRADTAQSASVTKVVAAALGLALTARCLAAPSPSTIDLNSLRLVPYPKMVAPEAGSFDLNRPLIVEASGAEGPGLAQSINDELVRGRLEPARVRPSRRERLELRIYSPSQGRGDRVSPLSDPRSEAYALEIRPGSIVAVGSDRAGLFYAMQTLRQLIRANRSEGALPCLRIQDWPSLKWRAFQDDLTRGPSSTLANLEAASALGAFLKLNIFTYYMEHQYAFTKHPDFGPPQGSLTPSDLSAWVDYARPLHLNILGNQQSFGHFTAILAHGEYADLRETPYLLSPVVPKVYQLLDDLYGDVIPHLPFPFFNVCCDETDGLGEGPSKPLVAKVGVGRVYVQHILRLHDLVKGKYGKRMMMWGDIILRHPDQLAAIPKDTVMLSWGYDPRANFEDQIFPFARSGFDFFVCPGVNNWNRLLPDFPAATTNIQNFVRDGIKHGALGMLNTAWDDDGQTLNAPNWHGFGWGAECAWNGSATGAADFNRRLGGVLFGERGDHFGQAIQLLSAPGIAGLPTEEFWKADSEPIDLSTVAARRGSLEDRRQRVAAAIEELRACRKEAVANGELVDALIYGAQRVAFVSQRAADRLDAALAYNEALQSKSEGAEAAVRRTETALRRSRDNLASLSAAFVELWNRENRPYALDWTVRRYQAALNAYDLRLARLEKARTGLRTGAALPTAKELGLELAPKQNGP